MNLHKAKNKITVLLPNDKDKQCKSYSIQRLYFQPGAFIMLSQLMRLHIIIIIVIFDLRQIEGALFKPDKEKYLLRY